MLCINWSLRTKFSHELKENHLTNDKRNFKTQGRASHTSGVLDGYFERNSEKVPRCCFVGVAPSDLYPLEEPKERITRGPFLEGPEKFTGRKAITKLLSLVFTELFFSHNFNTNKVSFHAKFNAYTLLSF